MGYFPNGSTGEDYYEHYCSRCIHDNMDKGIHCPVWNLHLLHNYDECNNKGSFLHVLIPRNDGGWNDRCTMFVDRGSLTNLQIEKIEHEMLTPEPPKP